MTYRNGDLWLNQSTGDFWRWDGDSWAYEGRIQGPPGVQGPSGDIDNLSDLLPLALGTASAGVLEAGARADHVHPIDGLVTSPTVERLFTGAVAPASPQVGDVWLDTSD